MATQLEIAEKLGISDRWLRNLISDGAIQNAGRNGFDFETVARQYIAYQQTEIARLKADAASKQAVLDEITANPDGMTKAGADTRRSMALAEKAEMEVAEMRGQLIPVDQVGDAVMTAVQVMVSKMNALPSKVASKIGARDPALAERTLRGEIYEALDSLSKIDVRGGDPATA